MSDAEAGVAIKLYIDGQAVPSLLAQVNLQRLCQQHLGKQFQIEVLDVAREPDVAVREQILALPTLEINSCGKRRRLVGDLSMAPKVIAAFGMVQTSRRMLDDSLASVERIKGHATNNSPLPDAQEPPAN